MSQSPETPTPANRSDVMSSTAFGVSARLVADGTQAVRGDWPTTHTFFCDETGNSGSRFYQPEQPLYVEAGWIVPRADRATLEAQIRALELRHKFIPQTKGASLKSSPRGRRYMLEVLETMRQVAAPFAYVVEKRYFVCSKAVETYFDPVYNGLINPQETWDPEARQSRAEKFYAGPEELIAAFAEAFRLEDADAVATVGAKWFEWFKRQGDTAFAAELENSLPAIAGHVRQEFASLHQHGLPRGYDSINLPSLYQVFQLIEQNVPPCDLLHDECATFEPVYRHAFDQSRDADPGAVVMNDGRRNVYGFRHLNSLLFGNSETEPLLRSADYLTACTADFARKSFEGVEVPPDLARLAHPTLGGILAWGLSHMTGEPMPQMGQVLGSKKFTGRVFGAMMKMTRPGGIADPNR